MDNKKALVLKIAVKMIEQDLEVQKGRKVVHGLEF
jgi:hypothetical protein